MEIHPSICEINMIMEAHHIYIYKHPDN
uniref:Uncharacterized protein n=1 Tax=Anguilla anguilla TaxID=7936 RepID=A0A0E9UJQ8_ANGAN